MEKQLSEATRRKRKFLMVLPLLVLPFLTMAFWALGGGRGGGDLSKPERQAGLNTRLPEAKFKANEKQDKFSIYEALAKENNESKLDPEELAFANSSEGMYEPNEQKIQEKLALIHTEMNRPAEVPNPVLNRKPAVQSGNMRSDVNRLEKLMKGIRSSNQEDQEMRQLDAVLEKILEIQNPGIAKEKIRQRVANSGNVHRVQIAQKEEDESGRAIQAVIHQDQTIVSGSVIKLRLLDSIYVGETLIPQNEFIYGIAAVSGERLKIEVATLRYRNAILPVSLSAFDLDGLEGLYTPGALTRDAMKNGADDAMQSLQIMTLDPSLSAQAATVGLQAAKGLFRKKARQIKVKVKAGYQLLLHDRNQRT